MGYYGATSEVGQDIGWDQNGRGGCFGGRLRLLEGYTSKGVMDILDFPTGLRFTGVQIHGTHEHLLSTVRISEACIKTLLWPSYTASFRRKSNPFS